MFFAPRNGADSKSKATSKRDDPIVQRMRPWVEKYRPKTIEDVAAQEHTVMVLKKALMSENLPHMLFYGPPGTGKTSTILALARQLFGPELMSSRVLELNASDERGISIVREKIKNFAKMAVSQPSKDFPCPPFKIVILDEADSMTHDAQSALRRIMEQYSRITRFCLVCNYVTRIIEPLTSRCSKFRFRTLDQDSTKERLELIAKSENVQFDDQVLDTLIKTSDGDLRRAITYLQSASRLHDSSSITVNSIIEIAGVIPDEVICDLTQIIGIDLRPGFKSSVSNNEKKIGKENFSNVRKEVGKIAKEGYSSSQLLIQLHDYIMQHETLNSIVKAKFAMIFAMVDKNLTDGGDEELQLLNLAIKMKQIIETS